jgi:hypothetical protein
MFQASRPELTRVLEPARGTCATRSSASTARSCALIAIVCAGGVASAEPPQAGPGSRAPASASAAPSAPKTVEKELEQFTKLPVDKAVFMYLKLLYEIRDPEAECERLRLQGHREFIARRESEFRKRVPADLAETFKRMTDRSARHARVLAISKMQVPERTAAVAKDSAQEQHVWKLRRQFDEERAKDQIPTLTSAASARTETGQRVREQESKLAALWAKADKMEANLFPRMSREEVTEMRKWPGFSALYEEEELDKLQGKYEAAWKSARAKELQARVPPELEAELAREENRARQRKRADEIRDMDSDAAMAARRKEAEERRKLNELFEAIEGEIKRDCPPLTIKADVDATALEEQYSWQKEKVATHRALSKKIEDLFEAKNGR